MEPAAPAPFVFDFEDEELKVRLLLRTPAHASNLILCSVQCNELVFTVQEEQLRERVYSEMLKFAKTKNQPASA